MFAILKKDFFSLFNNVVGFIFIAVNMAFYGLYFLANNLLSGSPSISATLGGVLLIMLITTPLYGRAEEQNGCIAVDLSGICQQDDHRQISCHGPGFFH